MLYCMYIYIYYTNRYGLAVNDSLNSGTSQLLQDGVRLAMIRGEAGLARAEPLGGGAVTSKVTTTCDVLQGSQ